MTDLAIVIPMFSRIEKLDDLFQSIENHSDISKVYVADNGRMSEEKEQLYESNYEFDLEVFDLEYDSGVGNCRRVLTERTDEEFLMFFDPDMYVPQNYDVMVDILQKNNRIGGVSGMIIDPGRIRTTASDLEERDGIIYRNVSEAKEIEYYDGKPFVQFDFVPQVGVFRRTCVDDYTWDSFYKTNGEHLDFFMGHKRKTDWTFGISPQISFPHFPGGPLEYERRRGSQEIIDEMYEYFHDKWGTEDVKTISGNWIDTYPHYTTKYEKAKVIYKNRGGIELLERSIKHIKGSIL